MATVVAGFSMSLDGFVADRSDNVGPLFDWYGNGEVEVRWPGNDMVSHTTPQSANYLHDLIDGAGALVPTPRLTGFLTSTVTARVRPCENFWRTCVASATVS